MEESLINLIKNSILNDYCKLICNQAMKEENSAYRKYFFLELMIYSVIYDVPYFVEKIQKINTKKDILNSKEGLDFIYLYYLEKNNKEDIKLKNEILKKYKNKKKKINKEIQTLKLINFDRKVIKYNHRKENYKVVKRFAEIEERIDIILECMKYKILIKYLNLESNSKIDRILNWNITLIKKYDNLKDMKWLI